MCTELGRPFASTDSVRSSTAHLPRGLTPHHERSRAFLDVALSLAAQGLARADQTAGAPLWVRAHNQWTTTWNAFNLIVGVQLISVHGAQGFRGELWLTAMKHGRADISA